MTGTDEARAPSGPRFAARASATSSAWTWRPVSRLNPRPRTRPVGDTTSAPTENAVGDGTQRRARATACPIHRARLRADGRAGAVALFLLDEADNGISGAVVELTDLQTGKKVAIFTEEGGKYQFSDLERNHDYEVKASYKGVPSEVRKASSLGEQQLILNLRIPPPQPGDK